MKTYLVSFSRARPYYTQFCSAVVTVTATLETVEHFSLLSEMARKSMSDSALEAEWVVTTCSLLRDQGADDLPCIVKSFELMPVVSVMPSNDSVPSRLRRWFKHNF